MHDWSTPSDSNEPGTLTSVYADAVQEVIDELGRLPGVGPKSAQRLAFHLLNLPSEDVARMTTAISSMKERVQF